ncbi:MAG: alpha/beta fold hydrolase [Burkholderiales bacterium]
MKPISDGFVSVNGLRLHYDAWPSSGPTVVCLHGTSLHGRVWSWLADSLHPQFNLIGLDQRGHGDSESAKPGEYTVDFYYEDFRQFADVMKLEKFSIVGSSLGSRVGLQYAAHHPERVESLVFLDLSFEMPKSASDEMIHAHITRPRDFTDFDEAMRFSKTLPQRSRFSDATHRLTLEGDLRLNAKGRLEWRYDRDAAIETLSVAARDMWEEVRHVECPVLVLRGGQSNVLIDSTAVRLPKEFKRGAVIAIPGAGHSIWGDNPEATSAAIKVFLERRDAASVVSAITALEA